jgi:hypothetical protein
MRFCYTEELFQGCKDKAVACLETIGELLKERIIADLERYKPYPIVDTGEFRNKLKFEVYDEGDAVSLRIWSPAKHSKYILFGSQYGAVMPPLQPLIAWVERKKLHWVDAKTGKELEAVQMAWMIRIKIFREGIAERPVFQEVFARKQGWIRTAIKSYLGS